MENKEIIDLLLIKLGEITYVGLYLSKLHKNARFLINYAPNIHSKAAQFNIILQFHNLDKKEQYIKHNQLVRFIQVQLRDFYDYIYISRLDSELSLSRTELKRCASTYSLEARDLLAFNHIN